MRNRDGIALGVCAGIFVTVAIAALAVGAVLSEPSVKRVPYNPVDITYKIPGDCVAPVGVSFIESSRQLGHIYAILVYIDNEGQMSFRSYKVPLEFPQGNDRLRGRFEE